MFGPTPQKKAMTPLHVMVGLPIALASVTAPARVEVLGRPALPLATYRDSALVALLQTVGGMHEPAHDAARLEPGRRVVAYLWVPVPGHGAVPDTLVNRVVVSSADSAALPQDETVAEARVPVRRAEAVVLSPP